MVTSVLGLALAVAGQAVPPRPDTAPRNELERLVLEAPMRIDAPGPLKDWLDGHTQFDLAIVRTFLQAGFTIFNGIDGCIGISWKRVLNPDGSGKSLSGYVCPERRFTYYMMMEEGPVPRPRPGSQPRFIQPR